MEKLVPGGGSKRRSSSRSSGWISVVFVKGLAITMVPNRGKSPLEGMTLSLEGMKLYRYPLTTGGMGWWRELRRRNGTKKIGNHGSIRSSLDLHSIGTVLHSHTFALMIGWSFLLRRTNPRDSTIDQTTAKRISFQTEANIIMPLTLVDWTLSWLKS